MTADTQRCCASQETAISKGLYDTQQRNYALSHGTAIDSLYDTQQRTYAPSRAAVIDDLYDTQQCSPSEQVQLTVSHHSVAIDQSLTVIVL